jgi:hypothetical protein
VAFDPGGRTLASAGQDGGIKLWHLPTGRELFDLPGGGLQGGLVRFDPGGRVLYVAE